MFPPERIVCLTEETVETLYLLGEERRIVGISGYVVRPPRARREKPRVSAFTSADIPKILALEPDLVLAFSDLQADIAATLIREGIDVHAFNQRTVAQILDMIRTLGALVGAADRAEPLGERVCGRDSLSARESAAQLPRRPRVYFEEWDDPMISGIGWVSELVEVAGGVDIFADRRSGKSAKDRFVTAEEVIQRGARHHHRLLVRQEVSPREGRQPARLRSHPGRSARRGARDQVAADPAAGAGGADRRPCRPAGDHWQLAGRGADAQPRARRRLLPVIRTLHVLAPSPLSSATVLTSRTRADRYATLFGRR